MRADSGAHQTSTHQKTRSSRNVTQVIRGWNVSRSPSPCGHTVRIPNFVVHGCESDQKFLSFSLLFLQYFSLFFLSFFFFFFAFLLFSFITFFQVARKEAKHPKVVFCLGKGGRVTTSSNKIGLGEGEG